LTRNTAGDASCSRHDNAIAEANMRYLTTGVTYRSHGSHEREDGEARSHESVLDHVYVTRDLEATVAVLTDSTTWSRPSRSTRSPPP
jgi:hypothetical protein